VQVIWILYDPVRAHYDALVPGMEVDKVALLDVQKAILTGVKKDAKNAKVRARQLRPINPSKVSRPPVEDACFTEAEDEADMDSGAQLHQGIDADGVVRDMTAYLEGASSVVKRRLPLVFPSDDTGLNSNVRSFLIMPAFAPRICMCDLFSSFVCLCLCTLFLFYTCLNDILCSRPNSTSSFPSLSVTGTTILTQST
jgi:hypothetical protein